MSDKGIYKIVDLGFAKEIKAGANSHTNLGTLLTMAPEVIKGQKYGLKADIWSVGIVLYEMVYGTLPYHAIHPNQMY